MIAYSFIHVIVVILKPDFVPLFKPLSGHFAD